MIEFQYSTIVEGGQSRARIGSWEACIDGLTARKKKKVEFTGDRGNRYPELLTES